MCPDVSSITQDRNHRHEAGPEQTAANHQEPRLKSMSCASKRTSRRISRSHPTGAGLPLMNHLALAGGKGIPPTGKGKHHRRAASFSPATFLLSLTRGDCASFSDVSCATADCPSTAGNTMFPSRSLSRTQPIRLLANFKANEARTAPDFLPRFFIPSSYFFFSPSFSITIWRSLHTIRRV